eukprot:CAMPEP_0171181158 /NCGR_PEP_ID=MMETSP0790-20130122/14119_1 /TAXON_ID=2925 /ORGANISM="Alexandrium catenella, Strain OF101" /LENGTH=60 /DNA_ID=CAMNT_0011646095 /DNA_START=165 /DNA_END=344 /DNA_ORIENTATION=-
MHIMWQVPQPRHAKKIGGWTWRRPSLPKLGARAARPCAPMRASSWYIMGGRIATQMDGSM